MALFLDSHTSGYAKEDGARQMIWHMATAINVELRELASSGCKVIPTLSTLPTGVKR